MNAAYLGPERSKISNNYTYGVLNDAVKDRHRLRMEFCTGIETCRKAKQPRRPCFYKIYVIVYRLRIVTDLA